MEFAFVILIISIAGGILGFFAAKKCKPGKVRKVERVLLWVALGVTIYAALEVSKVYLACVALIAGDLIGMAVPKKKE